MPRANGSFPGRVWQAWTIARIELRRAFFARRGLWVYVLALLPALVFFGHAVETSLRTLAEWLSVRSNLSCQPL